MADDPFGATHGRGQDDLHHRVQGDLPASARPGAVRRVAAGGGDEARPGGGRAQHAAHGPGPGEGVAWRAARAGGDPGGLRPDGADGARDLRREGRRAARVSATLLGTPPAKGTIELFYDGSGFTIVCPTTSAIIATIFALLSARKRSNNDASNVAITKSLSMAWPRRISSGIPDSPTTL
jgi:hypothetical protein